MLYEYPQEFVDSIMKLSRSNRPSSDTIYHGTVIPYVRVSPRSSDIFETISMSGTFSKLNIHTMGH
jgi:hypothetical protein